MKSQEELIQILEELSDRIRNNKDLYYIINKGGCAIFALAVVKKLGLPDGSIRYLVHNSQNVQKCKDNDIVESCSHAVIKVGDIYWDSNGFRECWKDFRYGSMECVADNEYVRKGCEDPRIWNDCFYNRRSRLIPIFMKEIKESVAMKVAF
jgi:hypothetical protein